LAALSATDSIRTNTIAFPDRSFPLSWFLGIAVLLILTRLPLFGHTLTWDEAWNLGALRSLVTGDGLFLERYNVHPPLYMWLGMLLAPDASGFEFRLTLLNLLLNTGALLVFISLISSLFDRYIALYTGLAYILLPGPLFFDTWLKRDPLVTLFCIMALWCFFRRRDLPTGFLLGLAMLAKETAVFYWGAVVLLVLVYRRGREWPLSMIKIFIPAILVAGWWFVFSSGWLENLNFFTGTTEFTKGHEGPWWYYFAKLHADLGWGGLPLLVIGFSLCLWRPDSSIMKQAGEYRLLPILLLLPAYLVLSLSTGKPAWANIVVLLPLALLVGIGSAGLGNLLAAAHVGKGEGDIHSKNVFHALFLLVVLLGIPLIMFRYDDYLARVSPNQFRVIETSQEIVAAVNAEVKDGERLLILPLSYRNNPLYPDPIFYNSLQVSVEILRSMNTQLDYPTFVNLVVEKRIHWVLMSPYVGNSQETLVQGLGRDIPFAERAGRLLSVAGLYRVDALWKGKEK